MEVVRQWLRLSVRLEPPQYSNDESSTIDDDDADHEGSPNDEPLNDGPDEVLDGASLNAQQLDDTSNDVGPLAEVHDIDEAVARNGFSAQDKARAMDISYWTTPLDLFTHGAASPLQRITRSDNPEKEILLYASGQFIDENKKKGNPRRAGCAVVFSYDIHQRAHFTKFLLEQHGPEGVRHDLNQKTAELRAVVAALELKAWRTEGWEKVTIATTSLYVHSGITKSIALWGAEGWLKGATHNGSQLQNSDLWARALALVNEQASRGCEVQFWLIKPAEAKDVVAAALMAAENQQTPTFYKSIGDMLSIPTPATSIAVTSAAITSTVATSTAVTLTAASLCDAEKKRRKKEKKQRRASEKLRLKLAK